MYCSQCGKEVIAQAKFCRACGAPQTDRDPSRPPPLPPRVESAAVNPAPPAGAATPQPLVYANFGQRLLAFLIDLLILFGLSIVIGAIWGATHPNSADQSGLTVLLTLGSFWIYKAVLESSAWQATLGKRAIRIKVTKRSGNRIGFGRATARFFAQALSYCFLCLGYIIAAFTPRRQALHDYIAGTLVTRRDRTPEDIAAASPAAAGSGLVIAVVATVGGVALIGILAAIAIPAYQDYTIRAQVTDALTHADAYKVAVVQAFANGSDPSSITTAPGGALTPTQNTGRYADSIDVTTGTIVITYGGQANPHLKGSHLAVYPVQPSNGNDILWVCGLGAPPVTLDSASLEAERRLTDVPARYLPSSCRQ